MGIQDRAVSEPRQAAARAFAQVPASREWKSRKGALCTFLAKSLHRETHAVLGRERGEPGITHAAGFTAPAGSQVQGSDPRRPGCSRRGPALPPAGSDGGAASAGRRAGFPGRKLPSREGAPRQDKGGEGGGEGDWKAGVPEGLARVQEGSGRAPAGRAWSRRGAARGPRGTGRGGLGPAGRAPPATHRTTHCSTR